MPLFKSFNIYWICLLASCASLQKDRLEKRKLPQVQEISAHVLTEQAGIELPDSLEKSPWQWRRSQSIGSVPQSMVSPQFVGEKHLLISTLGGGLSLVELKTGAKRWERSFPIGVASQPYVSEKSVYVATMNSKILKLSLKDGSTLWETKVSAESLGGMAFDRALLYVSIADDSLWAIDSKTGNALWTYKRPSPDSVVYWSLRGQATPVLGPSKESLYIGFSDGFFICLNPLNGETQWELDFRRNGRFQDADATVRFSPNGKVLYLSLVDGNLVAINAHTGQVLWTQASASHSAPYVDPQSGDVFYATSDSFVKRMSSDGLQTKWMLKLGKRGLASEMVEVGDSYLAATTTHFGVILIDKQRGKIVWEKYLGEGIVAPPSFNGKHLTVLSGRNYLRIYNVKI